MTTRTRAAVDIFAGAMRVAWFLILSFGCGVFVGLAAHVVYYALSFGWKLI